jgi:hypothetical protein
MMYRNKLHGLCLLLILLVSEHLFGQAQSGQSVRYMLTYHAPDDEYTAWVVPNYNTPNANNPETQERGATAQFTLRVPASFILTQVVDVRGQWDKKPFKLMPLAGADPNTAYYVLGKAPQETNYGEFRKGEPVALFRFRGQGGRADQISVMAPNDPIIRLADQRLSLNLTNSFYSRSGQRSSVSVRPLEQFEGVATVASLMADLEKNFGIANVSRVTDDPSPVVLYPNPTIEDVSVRFFSPSALVPAAIEVVDNRGTTVQKQTVQAKAGLNTTLLSLKNAPGGHYFIKVQLNDRLTVQALNKL